MAAMNTLQSNPATIESLPVEILEYGLQVSSLYEIGFEEEQYISRLIEMLRLHSAQAFEVDIYMVS